jgi:hypothetical protein
VVVKILVFWIGSACYLLHAGFLLGLFFYPEDGGHVTPKRQLTFNGLHGITSQKSELFFVIVIFAHSIGIHILLPLPFVRSRFGYANTV